MTCRNSCTLEITPYGPFKCTETYMLAMISMCMALFVSLRDAMQKRITCATQRLFSGTEGDGYMLASIVLSLLLHFLANVVFGAFRSW